MNDNRLENRKNFQKCTFNLLEKREQHNLSLRKKKLDDFIQDKRLKRNTTKNNFHIRSLEVDPAKLKIDSKFLSDDITTLINNWEVLKSMLISSDDDYVKYAVYKIRQLTISKLEEVIPFQKYIFQILVDKLKSTTDSSLIFEIYWIFVNLSATIDNNIETYDPEIFSSDEIIDIFFTHLHSEYVDIVENLLWFLTHIVRDSAICRDKIINSKIYDEVIKILRLESNPLNIIHFTIWFATSLCANTQTTPLESKIYECLEIFSGYMYLTDDMEIVSHCIWGIFNISNFDQKITSIHGKILQSGSIVKLFKLNYNKNRLYAQPVIRLLGNMCSGHPIIVQELLTLNILDFFECFLTQVQFKCLRRDICWAVSNITAGTYPQVEKFLNSSISDTMFDYLNDSDACVKREAVWVYSNVCSAGVFEQCNKLVMKGLLVIICDFLNKENSDKILVPILELLKNILLAGEGSRSYDGTNPFLSKFELHNGSEAVEKLMFHKDTKVYELSELILTSFFKTEVI